MRKLVSPDKKVVLYMGDSNLVLDILAENSIDSCVTDTPYEINFKNHSWDRSGIAFSVDFWKKVYRVLKPGSWVAAFSATRTYHRMTCGIEDAGFEIKDSLAWVYSNGFPKNLDIYKAMLKTGIPNAEDYKGCGTALSPSFEPIVLARKPLEGTNIQNILKYGTGGLNIDKCMIGDEVRYHPLTPIEFFGIDAGDAKGEIQKYCGRWPKNVIHDGSQEVIDTFNTSTSVRSKESPSRFFYSAKASTKEKQFTTHSTVKPLALMKYVIDLVTPSNGVVIDPFAGSGSTGVAARLQGYRSVLIEITPSYQDEIAHRLGIKADFSAIDPDVEAEQFENENPPSDLVSFLD